MREGVTGDGLTDRQRRFVAGVRRGLTGTEAARRAGYTGSDATLRVRASKLRRHPKVVEALEQQPPEQPAAAALEVPRPQPGPQTVLADCIADLAIFGGSAGGGKSWSLLFEPVKWATFDGERWRLPSGMRAVLFRRTSPELMGGGGLWDESHDMYRALGGFPRRSPAPDWIFAGTERGDARIEFRHLQRDSEVYKHQGRQYTIVGFDELTHFTAKQFWYLVGRLRSTCGIKPYLRATCNPDPDSFVAELVAWWIGEDGYPIPERSGVLRWLVRVDDTIHWYDTREAARAAHPTCRVTLDDGTSVKFPNAARARAAYPDREIEHDVEPLSFTFIASRLKDNAALTSKDPSYRAKLLALARVDRARLLGDEDRGGNWKERAGAGMYFRRADFRVVTEPPSKILRTVRFWDKASSEPTPKHPNPDWTRGVRVSLCEGGALWIDDLASLQGRPVSVLRLMRRTAEEDRVRVEVGLWQDTGGAGLVDVDATRAVLTGFAVDVVQSFSADTTATSDGGHKSSRAKRVFAKVWTTLVEHHLVYVLRAPWTEELLNECDAFPDGRFDDIVDAISGAVQVLLGPEGANGGGFWGANTNDVLAALQRFARGRR